MAEPTVTNAEILQALQVLGWDVPMTVSTKGAQTGAFRENIVKALGGSKNAYGYDDAKRLAQASKRGLTADEMEEFLFQSGVGFETLAEIAKVAAASAANAPDRQREDGKKNVPFNQREFDVVVADAARAGARGVRTVWRKLTHDKNKKDPGREQYADDAFEDQDWLKAAQQVLGADNPLTSLFSQKAAFSTPEKAYQQYRAGERGTIPPTGKGEPSDAYVKFRQGERDSLKPPEVPREPLPGDGLGDAGGLGTGQPGITSTLPESTPFGEPVPTDPREVDAYIRRNFGYWSFLLDDPELGPKFRELATSKASANMIQAAVLNSNWYKTHTAAQQTWAALASTNPAQANAQLQSRAKDISDITRRYGMTLDPTRMSKLAEDSLKYGWTDQQVMAAISNEGVFAEGKSNPVKARLQQTASDYVLNFSGQAIDTWTKQIMAGEATEEEFKLYAQEQAASMYPTLAAALASGRTVKQYADQYVQKAASVLEISPDKINLQESKWQKALQHRNPKTGEIQSMTLAEWEDYLKTDPSYNYNKTKGARQDARAFATTIAQTFGAA